MPNVLVRDVPEDVHAELVRRADAAGMSLQQHLAGELARLARSPQLGEVLARIERRRGGAVGFTRAVDDLSEERSRS